tara:strand:+ start:20105 stop:21055 length:951 start_codon:yes stop_codon:yes gene_type:complete
VNQNSILVDCHQDIAYSVRANRRLFEENIENLMISYESLVNSKINIIFSTIFVSHRRKDSHYDEAIKQIKLYESIFKKYKNFYHLKNFKSLKNINKKRIGLYFLMEGAEPIKKIKDLNIFYEKGVRTIGLTWNDENKYAFGVSKNGPLKEDGIKLINKMNDLGISLDLSHLSEISFKRAIKETKLIPIATHSNCKKIRRHERNLSNKQLKNISDLGGVIGIVLYNRFISSKKNVSISDILPHFKNILNICGEDHISLGSDIDGAPIKDFPNEIRKPSDLEKISDMLKKNKIKSKIIDKFLGQNILRVLDENLRDKK